jgi:membrane-associated phospholipid phosphatase
MRPRSLSQLKLEEEKMFENTDTTTRTQQHVTRRGFLGRLAALPALATGASVSAAPLAAQAASRAAPGANIVRDPRRAAAALKLRVRQAVTQMLQANALAHRTNGDEQRYADFGYVASFTKALPHNGAGEVDVTAYRALLHALGTGSAADFEAISLAGALKLADPQAAFAFQLEGADAQALTIAAPPAFASEEQAGEMAELYWQALARDVAFSQYGQERITADAIADLRQFSNFASTGAATLFRSAFAGEAVGPYVSQFLYRDVPYGPMTIAQQYSSPLLGQDFMRTVPEWMSIQNGVPAANRTQYQSAPRYIRNGRDLAEYVRKDFSYQAFLNAALILTGMGGAALDATNPYKQYAKQSGFITFGAPDVLSMVAQVAAHALKAAWFHKWLVHRRVRPEEYAGRVHHHLLSARYPLHAKLLHSGALQRLLAQTNAALLPMAFPEGCPCHPAYPAGHAVIAGACTTVLKAFFNESLAFANADVKVPADDGLSWQSYGGPALTVGGELNKLAANISIGRNIAGVHWQSDGVEGMKLGEAVALAYLRDVKPTYREESAGLSLTKFDGVRVTI